jgi:hypothetical protein
MQFGFYCLWFDENSTGHNYELGQWFVLELMSNLEFKVFDNYIDMLAMKFSIVLVLKLCGDDLEQKRA